MPIKPLSFTPLLSLSLLLPASARAQETAKPQPSVAQKQDVLPGHSLHGETFDEGPRQKAYLMKGMGKVSFPVTTKSSLAQKFFNQGVAQLHGFWYLESERSFRQVADIDPDCAMAYWGMAMANVNNEKRARGFIKEAVKRETAASPRERLWIDAWAAFYTDAKEKPSDKERRRQLAKSLETIVKQYPNDDEAKAFYGVQIWFNQGQIPIFSRRTVDALHHAVLKKNPLHPLHHYRIHLWDGPEAQAKNAVNSAALGGPSSPGIAHMWHMPGHIYSDLRRYADAAWSQEASARTDHAHMMRDHVLPDQIHNYAHNNQWLITDLSHIGRVHDAVDLAKNMIELPRHPRYNNVNNWGGSARYGRTRLLEVLVRYELWDALIDLGNTVYLEPTDIQEEQINRLKALGIAYFSKGQMEKGREQMAAVQALIDKVAPKEAEKDGKPNDDFKTRGLRKALSEMRTYEALATGQPDAARKELQELTDLPTERRARLWLQAGDKDQAEKLAKKAVDDQPNEVQPLASYVEVLEACGKTETAGKEFEKLRALSGYVDMDAPIFQRLSKLAQLWGYSADWRAAPTVPADIGKRPDLNKLGPFRWSPPEAAKWTLKDASGRKVSLDDYTKKGKPVIVVFYLGAGCEHCVEQLKLFAPMWPEFDDAGISMVAVSTEAAGDLKNTFAKRETPFPFPILANDDLKVFKSYRAYDDFEEVPLHGTFLIDGKGRVRWQDISYEPFKEIKFLLAESKRLLAQDAVAAVGAPKRVSKK
jgi:peroxiredoxin/tetratricopeptide (TPR) repeat protein